MQERSVNLVFQGGGVRGIAYAGVLSTMPEWVRITGVGGTSAGALVSGLSLALIGNASAQKLPGRRAGTEAFSMRRQVGSRWCLRRTRSAMGF